MKSIDEMKRKIKAKEELSDLEWKVLNMVFKFYQAVHSEKIPDTPFICGEGGEIGEDHLPEVFHITPTYGLDWSVPYKKMDLKK